MLQYHKALIALNMKFLCLQGADGRDGRPGTPGKDGIPGKDGTDFSSVKIMERLINHTVQKGK